MRFRITKCKAQILGNSQTIAKICNAEIGGSRLIDAVHELIRGSLSYIGFTGTASAASFCPSISVAAFLREVNKR